MPLLMPLPMDDADHTRARGAATRDRVDRVASRSLASRLASRVVGLVRLSPRIATLWSLAVLCLVLIVPVAHGQTAGVGQSNRDFEQSVQPIRESITRLNTRIAEAMQGLEAVAELPTEEAQEEGLNAVFIEMRGEVNDVLAKLSSTGEFATSLTRARASSQELLVWYQRREPEYPNREAMIEQLKDAVAQYDLVEDQLMAGRTEANRRLVDVMRQQRVAIQEAKATTVMEGVRVAQAVVAGLQELTRDLEDFAASAIQPGTASIPQ